MNVDTHVELSHKKNRSLYPEIETGLHPLQCQSMRLDPTQKCRVALFPLLPRQAEVISRRVLDSVERGQAQLQLQSVRIMESWGSSHFFASLTHGNKATDEQMLAARVQFPQNDPFTLGSLVQLGSTFHQLECTAADSTSDGSPFAFGYPDSTLSPPFLFGNDLTRLVQRDSSTQELLLGDNAICWAPPTQLPRMLSLLPEPTIFPCTPTLWTDDGGPKNLRECNILLHGPAGSGKTRSALLIAAWARVRLQACTVYFDCRRHKDAATQLEDLLKALTDLIDNARRSDGPCVVLLDDLDEICPDLMPQRLGANNQDSRSAKAMVQTSPSEIEQVKAVRDHLYNLFSTAENLAIVATCRDVDAVAWSFPREYHLSQSITLPILSSENKVALLEKLASKRNAMEEPKLCAAASRSATTTSTLPLEFRLRDLLPKDIEMLATRVLKQHEFAPSSELWNVVREELGRYVPLSRRAAAEEPRESFLDWHTEIGGLFDAKKALVDLVIRPIKFRHINETSRIRLPKGILLFGPRGCGKSILPASLAKEVGLPLIVCRGPEILDKYMGASEAKVRALFERANLSAPSILFLDEIDSLAPHRGSDLTGVTDRVVNQLLTFLDGVEDTTAGKTVFVIVSSSRPDKIDTALLRPGRLEKHVYIGHPSSRRELQDVWVKVAGKYPVDPTVKEALESGMFLEEMYNKVSKSRMDHSCMSPSDIKAVMDTAQIRVVREYLKSNSEQDVPSVGFSHDTGIPKIQRTHLEESLQSSQIGLAEPESLQLKQIYDRFRNKNSGRHDPNTSVQRVALK